MHSHACADPSDTLGMVAHPSWVQMRGSTVIGTGAESIQRGHFCKQKGLRVGRGKVSEQDLVTDQHFLSENIPANQYCHIGEKWLEEFAHKVLECKGYDSGICICIYIYI
jgi:hypothetical protein